MNVEHGQAVLRRRFGERAVLAVSAGQWSVIIMQQRNYGSGVTITDSCQTINRAVSQAIQYAIEERVGVGPPF